MKIGSNAKNSIKAFYTPDELAEFLAISKPTIYRLVGKRQIPFTKVSGVLRFNRNDIDSYLAECRVEPIKM